MSPTLPDGDTTPAGIERLELAAPGSTTWTSCTRSPAATRTWIPSSLRDATAAARLSSPTSSGRTASRSSSGRFVVEVDGEPAGTFTFEQVNERSAIAELRNLALDPSSRGRGIAVEAARLVQRHLIADLAFHRIQLEVYGFNTRAQAHAEKAGYTREGVRGETPTGTGNRMAGPTACSTPWSPRTSTTTPVRTDSLRAWRAISTPWSGSPTRRKSREFYEALGFAFGREIDIVRNGELEATNFFFSIGDRERPRADLQPRRPDATSWAPATATSRSASRISTARSPLPAGIEPERPPYTVTRGRLADLLRPRSDTTASRSSRPATRPPYQCVRRLRRPL